MAILKTCCGCFTIESGTTLVGLFSFLTSAITFIGVLPAMPNPRNAYFQHAIYTGDLEGLRNDREEVLHITYIMMTVLVSINMISSLLMLLGVKHRNRFLLLPWIVWTGLTIAICQVWMVLTTAPVLMGDFMGIFFFIWGELCVISHYQNLRDGIREEEFEELAGQRRVMFVGVPQNHNTMSAEETAGSPTQAEAERASGGGGQITTLNDPPPPYPGGQSLVENHPPSSTLTESTKVEHQPSSALSTPPPNYEECFPANPGSTNNAEPS